MLNLATKGKHIHWQKKQYWLASLPALKGKCTPAVIASLAVALQRPIGIVNTRRRKTMEIRGLALRRGRYFLGFKKNIYGWVEFGDPQ